MIFFPDEMTIFNPAARRLLEMTCACFQFGIDINLPGFLCSCLRFLPSSALLLLISSAFFSSSVETLSGIVICQRG